LGEDGDLTSDIGHRTNATELVSHTSEGNNFRVVFRPVCFLLLVYRFIRPSQEIKVTCERYHSVDS
jgi:hypothetical protein